MNTQEMIFVGRLGKEPELKYTYKGSVPICFLSVAHNQIGVAKTIWRRVVVFGKQAELAKVWLKKGSQIFVQGHITIQEYPDKDGETKNIEEVRAQLIGFANL